MQITRFQSLNPVRFGESLRSKISKLNGVTREDAEQFDSWKGLLAVPAINRNGVVITRKEILELAAKEERRYERGPGSLTEWIEWVGEAFTRAPDKKKVEQAMTVFAREGLFESDTVESGGGYVAVSYSDRWSLSDLARAGLRTERI